MRLVSSFSETIPDLSKYSLTRIVGNPNDPYGFIIIDEISEIGGGDNAAAVMANKNVKKPKSASSTTRAMRAAPNAAVAPITFTVLTAKAVSTPGTDVIWVKVVHDPNLILDNRFQVLTTSPSDIVGAQMSDKVPLANGEFVVLTNEAWLKDRTPNPTKRIKYDFVAGSPDWVYLEIRYANGTNAPYMRFHFK